jgi:hypothetical protein
LLLVFPSPTLGIKFSLQAFRYPPAKCIWNAAHSNTLVIVTANVGPNENQRMDIEIVDSSPKKNVYLSKRGIKGESRLAVTSHGEGEVGVCLRNYIEGGEFGIWVTIEAVLKEILLQTCRTKRPVSWLLL